MAESPSQSGGPLGGCTYTLYSVHSADGRRGFAAEREHSTVLKMLGDSASETAPGGYHRNYRRRRWLRCWYCVGTIASAALLLFLPASCSLLAENPKCAAECRLHASSGSQEGALNRWSSSTGSGEAGSSGNVRWPAGPQRQHHHGRDVAQRGSGVAEALEAKGPDDDSAARRSDGAVRTAAISAVPLNTGATLSHTSNASVAAQSMVAASSDLSGVAEKGSKAGTEKSELGAASSDAGVPEALHEGLMSEKATKKDVRSFYSFFVDPQALEHAIRSYGTDEKFYSIFHPLYKNRAIAQLINGLNDNGFEVKARLSRVVERHEGTLASDVETSDLGFMERKRRQEDTLHTGKTGIFIIIFKRLLDWVYGRDFLESAMRDRQAKWKILSRLSEYGVSEKDLTPAQLKAIVELQLSKKRPFGGVAFDPFAKEFPSLDAAALEDVRGVDVTKLLKAIEEKQTPEPESTVPLLKASSAAEGSA